jgi:hypothetical protein
MNRPRFHLWHSILTTAVLVLIELAFLHAPLRDAETLLLALAIVGATVTIYAATEAIEEVRGSRMLFIVLTFVLTQFVLFFAFEFWVLDTIQPLAFPSLTNGPAAYLLSSLMAFVLNPLYLPATPSGQLLLNLETIGAVGIVLFAVQNIAQLRPRWLDKAK